MGWGSKDQGPSSQIDCHGHVHAHYLLGAATIRQVDHVEAIIKKTGQPFTRITIPNMEHYMHLVDPALFASTLIDWAKTLPSEEETRAGGIFAKG